MAEPVTFARLGDPRKGMSAIAISRWSSRLASIFLVLVALAGIVRHVLVDVRTFTGSRIMETMGATPGENPGQQSAPDNWFRFAAGMVLTAGAAASDLVRRQIPNGLVVTGAVAGAAMCLASSGLRGLVDVVVFAVLLTAIFGVAGAKKWMGFGDVKLIGVLPIVLGWRLAVASVACGFVIGGLYAAAYLLMASRLAPRLKSTGQRQEGGRVLLPLAPFLFLGVLVAPFLS